MSPRLTCLALTTTLLAAHTAHAEPTTLNFDDLSELEAAGFEHLEGGTTTASDGILTITGDSFEEWRLSAGAGAWWQSSRSEGWLVEARIRIVASEPDCISTGFWVTDSAITKVQLADSWAGISYPARSGVDMDTTDDFHVYRLQHLGRNRYHFIVDGELIADVHQLDQGAGSQVLMFGDLGGCSGATSEWDYFTYDPAPNPVLEGDADGDGVPNDMDSCALVEDPEGEDSDGDGDGDACDACPFDPMNDVDSDGICGDEDVCPEDFRNDADGDGVCDTEQCEPWDRATSSCNGPDCQRDPECPDICDCEPPFFGVDPIGTVPVGQPLPLPTTPVAEPEATPDEPGAEPQEPEDEPQQGGMDEQVDPEPSRDSASSDDHDETGTPAPNAPTSEDDPEGDEPQGATGAANVEAIDGDGADVEDSADGANGADPSSESFEEDDVAKMSTESSGGGCSLSAGSANDGWAWMLGALGLSALARRRRSSRRGR